MAYKKEMQPGWGSVGFNKSENKKAPHFVGDITDPNGKLWRIALWERHEKNSTQKKFNGFNVKLQEPQQQQNATRPQQGQQQGGYQSQGQQPPQDHQAPIQDNSAQGGYIDGGLDDEIPF